MACQLSGGRLNRGNTRCTSPWSRATFRFRTQPSLDTTQPAISRSVAELERTTGVRLLDRNSQGVEVTEYGRVLLDGGVAVFDDPRQAVKDIKFLADPTAGEVRIGRSNILGANFVSAIIHRLSRQHPHIVFHLVTGYVESLHRQLSERNVDLVIAP